MTQQHPGPPSFEPRRHVPRPPAEGAKRVGSTPKNAKESSLKSLHESEAAAMQKFPRTSLNQASNQASKLRNSYNTASSSRGMSRGAMPASYQPRSTTHRERPIGVTPQSQPPRKSPRRRSRKKLVAGIIAIILVLAIATPILWVLHLINYGNSRLTHVDALSGAENTPGTTYLIVGSDQRSEEMAANGDATSGQRADTIMLLHKPDSGTPSLVSLPRDAWVQIPNYGEDRINAAFAWGGPQLLVQTVENLTGLTVDHYVQVGMDGVADLTDAVGGVELCLTNESGTIHFDDNGWIYNPENYAIKEGTDHPFDPESGLEWQEGCHMVDGTTALAFSRMRKADATQDIGRTQRQRQVVSKVMAKATSKEILLSPSKQKQLVDGAASALTMDTASSIIDLGYAGLALRDAMGEKGVSGLPPIAHIQAIVELDMQAAPDFWAKVRDGNVTADDFYHP